MRRGVALAGAMLLALGALHAAVGDEGGQALKPRLSGRALVEALAQGGYVILMRHQATEEMAPDPAVFDIEDCDTQRNLSEEGRQAAREIGAAFQKLGIRVGEVLASPYCRCLETGKLAFGRAEPSELLAVFDRLPSVKKDERGAEIRQLLATPPAEAGTNTVLITHTGTLLYSFGLDTTPEGIAHVFKPGPVPGVSQYVGRIDPDEWAALAAGVSSPRP
jgi:phosphohistidine phosphatase SixA